MHGVTMKITVAVEMKYLQRITQKISLMMTAYIWFKRQKLANTLSNLSFQNKSEFHTERNKYSLIRDINVSVCAIVNLVPQLKVKHLREKLFHSPTSHFMNYFLQTSTDFVNRLFF